jgi:hypothetical protein
MDQVDLDGSFESFGESKGGPYGFQIAGRAAEQEVNLQAHVFPVPFSNSDKAAFQADK